MSKQDKILADWKRLSEAATEIMGVLEKHNLSILEARKVTNAVSDSVEGQFYKLARDSAIVSEQMDVRP